MISRVGVCAPPKVQKILSSSMNLSPLRNNYYTTVVDRIPFLSDPFISVCFVEIVINCFCYILASHIFFIFKDILYFQSCQNLQSLLVLVNIFILYVFCTLFLLKLWSTIISLNLLVFNGVMHFFVHMIYIVNLPVSQCFTFVLYCKFVFCLVCSFYDIKS